jgi:hypothetical protein
MTPFEGKSWPVVMNGGISKPGGSWSAMSLSRRIPKTGIPAPCNRGIAISNGN